MDEEVAKREVEDKWVAWAESQRGKDAWFVSPEGLEELIRDRARKLNVTRYDV